MPIMDIKDSLAEVLRAFRIYTDPDGMLQPIPNPQRDASGNGLRYTSEAALILNNWGVPDMGRYLWDIYSRCRVGDTSLVSRSPGKRSERESWDDYVALAAAGSQLRSTIPRLIWSWGMKHNWVYNNIEPDLWAWWAWFGRFPTIIAHIEYAARIKPPLWRRIWWALSLSLDAWAPKSDPDRWTMAWLRTVAYPGGDLLGDIAVRLWWSRVSTVWGERALRGAYAEYFQNQGHPLARYWLPARYETNIRPMT